MAYEQKAGNGALFKNDRKEKETHPDYKGDAKLPDGTDVWLAAWLKEGTKGKFLSISIQPKEEKASQPAPQAATEEPPFNDDIPF